MAIALKGTGSATTANSTTADQATLVVTTATTAGAAGDLAVLLYAVDNNQTTDGDEGAVTAVTDSGGNKWVKAVEFTNGQGTAQTGATSGIWYSNLRFALATSSTVTLTFSNATSRDATAASLTYFTKAAGYDAVIEGTPGTLANDAAGAGSLNVTTANVSCLRIRAIASEALLATALTPTNTFAVVTQAIANSGTAATSMGVRGEWVINTGTGTASAPSAGAGAVDNASVYVAFKETLTAWFDNNSRDVGAQVAIAARSVIASLIVAASAGLFLPPLPPPQAPQGWQQPLSIARPVTRVTAPSYDLPLAPVAASSATGVPLHFGSGTPRLRQVYYQARFEPPYVAPTQAAPIPIPLDLGGQLPQTRAIYYQARSEPPYVAPVVVVTSTLGWLAPLSIGLPVNRVIDTNWSLPWLTPSSVTLGQWQQPLSVAPKAAKAQTDFGFVPFDKAQVSVNFTAFGWQQALSTAPLVKPAVDTNGQFPWFTPNPVRLDQWQQPLSVAPSTTKAKAEFGFAPYATQVTVTVASPYWQPPLSGAPPVIAPQAGFSFVPYNTAQITVAVATGWQQQLSTAPTVNRAPIADYAQVYTAPTVTPYWLAQLSTAPLVTRVVTVDYSLPIYIAPASNTVTIDKWQQPLSVPPKTATAQPGFGFVPFNTAQIVVTPATATGVPLYSGGAPPRLRRVYYQARFEPPYTVPIVVIPKIGIPVDMGGLLPQQRSVYYQARFEPPYVAPVVATTPPTGWASPLSIAPVVRRASASDYAPVPYNQIATVAGWQTPLSVAVAVRRAPEVVYQLPVYPVAAANNTVELAKWQQPLSGAPAVAKAQPGFGFVPFNTAQLVAGVYLDFYLQPLSVAPPVVRAQVGFGSVPFNTAQVAVNYTVFGWQQPLSVAPASARARYENWSQPYQVAVVVSLGWQPPLASAPAASKAQAGFGIVPLYTSPVGIAGIAGMAWFTPLGTVPARNLVAREGSSFVPFNTVQVAPPTPTVPDVTGGNGGHRKPVHPTEFVPIKRKGGYIEPKLEDRVEVRRPKPAEPPAPEPIEIKIEPPVLLDILKGVLAPERIAFESDEDAVARVLEAYLEQENVVRSAISEAAIEIIESIIQEIIDDLEPDEPTQVS